ncbi:MAG: hypothetical protein AB7G62_18280, partial [Magnetospirillum sp.]
MTGAKAVQRPSWLMVVLGLLGLLASLGPAAFSMVMDWHDTRDQAQHRVDSLVAVLAQDVALSLDHNRAVLSRLGLLLRDTTNPSKAALVDLIDPKGQGWVGLYGRNEGLRVASADTVPARVPDRPISFIRHDNEEASLVLVEPVPGGQRLMVAAVPVPVLQST